MTIRRYFLFCMMGLSFYKAGLAQDADCRKVLEAAFDHYNFIEHPVKRGQVYLFQTTTTIENASGGDVENENYSTTFYLGYHKTVMISKEAELYEDEQYSIRIYPNDRSIHIYRNKVHDSVKKKNTDQMVQTNLKLLESLAGIACTSPGGNIVRFETGVSDSSYIRKKIIDIDRDRHTFKNYTVYTNETDGSSRKIFTVYTKSALAEEEEFMKGDFIHLVYDRSNKLVTKYNHYKIIDHRNN